MFTLSQMYISVNILKFLTSNRYYFFSGSSSFRRISFGRQRKKCIIINNKVQHAKIITINNHLSKKIYCVNSNIKNMQNLIKTRLYLNDFINFFNKTETKFI